MKEKIILVDKAAGWTSFDVVAKLRGKIRSCFREKAIQPTKRQQKVGHAGTLDPFATGLLVVLLGDATKKADEFLKLDKTYEATIRLGEVSTTGDPEGEISPVSQVQPSREAIIQSLQSFTGQIEQTPPVYSAIKVNGRRAYQLARAGKEVVIPSRQVTIYSLRLLDYSYPQVRIEAAVSSGTYIRTLAQDIGQSLGVGAYCQALRRTKIAEWSIDQAVTVDNVAVDDYVTAVLSDS